MNDPQEAVEFKLDGLTKSVRFAAGIAPKAATRVGLGVALAIEDTATDRAGELLGVKLHQGAAALTSGIGVIGSSVREKVRAHASRRASGPRSVVPGLQKAKDFIAQGMGEVSDSWASAGYISVQVEQPQGPESEALSAPAIGHESAPSAVDASEEVN